MKKLSRLSPVLVCFVLLSGGLASAAKRPKSEKLPVVAYENYRLPNGLEVILSEDHTLPLVAVNLWYHVGPANERPGRTGFAHLFEHMMFEGSEHVGPKEPFRYLEAAGATNINGTTSFDRTNYFETVPSNQLEVALWLESDRMGYLLPTLDQTKLTNQRDVVRNERRQRTENAPYGLVEEEIYHQLFPKGHPYYANVIGSHADIEAARLGDVREFFREFYSPNNASLAIVGDFDPKEVKALVEKYFATLPSGPQVPKIDIITPPITSERRAVVNDQVQLPRVYLTWLTPPIYKPGDAEADLLAQVLGGGKTSRLYRKLVREKQIAQDVSAENDSEMLGSVFEVYATAKPGVKPEELERAMEAEIEDLRTHGPSREELERAVNVLESNAIRSLEDFGHVADRLNQYNRYLGNPGYIAKDLGRYEKVTVSDLRDAAEMELKPTARVVVYGVPGKKVIEDVRRTTPEEEAKDGASESRPSAAPVEAWRNQAPKANRSLAFAPPVSVEFELPNGLKVLLVERHKLPIVAASVVVLSGAERNPQDKSGLASFTVDMLREGTEKRNAEELAADVEQFGAVLRTASGYDSVSVSLHTLSRSKDSGLRLLADVSLHPAFDPKEVERQRSHRLTALVEEQDHPAALRIRTMNRVLYGETAYGYTSIGSERSIDSIRPDDLREFWKRGFVPSNAALVVAGDIREAELRELSMKYFGDWTGAPVHPVVLTAAGDPKRAVYIVDKPGAPQTSLAVATIGAPRSSADYLPLEVMNMVFGGQFSSRLNMNLREEHGYTYGAHSGFSFRRAAGPFSASAGIRTDATAPAVREMFHEVDRIRNSQVSAEELRLAKSAWALSLAGNFETTVDITANEGDLFVYGLASDYYGGLAKRIDNVSAEDVKRVADRYLHPESMVVIAVGDRARIAPDLEKLGLGPVEIVP